MARLAISLPKTREINCLSAYLLFISIVQIELRLPPLEVGTVGQKTCRCYREDGWQLVIVLFLRETRDFCEVINCSERIPPDATGLNMPTRSTHDLPQNIASLFQRKQHET